MAARGVERLDPEGDGDGRILDTDRLRLHAASLLQVEPQRFAILRRGGEEVERPLEIDLVADIVEPVQHDRTDDARIEPAHHLRSITQMSLSLWRTVTYSRSPAISMAPGYVAAESAGSSNATAKRGAPPATGHDQIRGARPARRSR